MISSSSAAEYNFIVYMDHIFFMHSCVDRHVDWFCFLAVMSNAAITVGVPLSMVGFLVFSASAHEWGQLWQHLEAC